MPCTSLLSCIVWGIMTSSVKKHLLSSPPPQEFSVHSEFYLRTKNLGIQKNQLYFLQLSFIEQKVAHWLNADGKSGSWSAYLLPSSNSKLLKNSCQKKNYWGPNWAPVASLAVGQVSPGSIIGILYLMFFILTFERTVIVGGLLENCIQVDYFSILEGKSNIYEFLTWHKGTPGHTAFHPNCIPRPVESSIFGHLPCNATEACDSDTVIYALSWFTA